MERVFFCGLVAAVLLGNGLSPAMAQDKSDKDVLAVTIRGLDVPYGVDEARWGMICQRLLDGLDANPPPAVARPPVGRDNAVGEIAFRTDGAGRYWLEWTHFSLGDYDQDGTVNQDDLTSLAGAFGKDRSAEDWKYCSGNDGNRDGKVDEKDVDVIAHNWGTQVKAYQLHSGDGSGAPAAQAPIPLAGEPGMFATVSFDEFEGFPGSAHRFVYRFRDRAALGRCYWVRPVAGEQAGQPSSVACEPDPAARLKVDGESTPPPCKARLLAEGCRATRGDVQDYEWDLDGNGKFNEEVDGEAAFRGKAEAVADWQRNVSFAASVRVTAATGVTVGSVPVSLLTRVPWSELAPDYVFLDDKERFHRGVTVFLCAGNPAVLYTGADLDKGKTLLRFRRAEDANGSTWGEARTLAELGGMGDDDEFMPSGPDFAAFGPVISLGDGPAVAYTLGRDVYFLAAKKADGSEWEQPGLVLGEAEADGAPILALVKGKPAVAWSRSVDEGPDEVCLALASDPGGKNWGEPSVTAGRIEPTDEGQGPYPLAVSESGGDVLVLTAWKLYGTTETSLARLSGGKWSVVRILRHEDQEGMSSVDAAPGLLDFGDEGGVLMVTRSVVGTTADLRVWQARKPSAVSKVFLAKLTTAAGHPPFQGTPDEHGFVRRYHVVASPTGGEKGALPPVPVILFLEACYGGGSVYAQAVHGGSPSRPWTTTPRADFGAATSNMFLSGYAFEPESRPEEPPHWRLHLFVTNESAGDFSLTIGSLQL